LATFFAVDYPNDGNTVNLVCTVSRRRNAKIWGQNPRRRSDCLTAREKEGCNPRRFPFSPAPKILPIKNLTQELRSLFFANYLVLKLKTSPYSCFLAKKMLFRISCVKFFDNSEITITQKKLLRYSKSVKTGVGFLYNFALKGMGEIFLKPGVVKNFDDELPC
jgi:hypothetical protein